MKKIRQITAYILVLIILYTDIYANGLDVNAEAINTEITLYFVDNTSEQWIRNNNAVIELVDNSNGHIHYDMTQVDDRTWKAQVPEAAYNITFNRYDSGKTTQWNSWSAGGRDSSNTYYADGSEYGHWDYSEIEEDEEENYFHAGDIVYLDVTEFTAWENDGALMYINFTDASKENNNGDDINLSNTDKALYQPELTDYVQTNHVYAYIVSKQEEGKEILRFWRGNSDALWNCSITMDYNEYKEGYNCVNVSGWDLSGYLSKKEYDINVEIDRDQDLVPDYIEAILGLDKSKADTDEDGLSDYDELVFTKTDPLKYDSVKEGISDGEIDSDLDGILNIDEINLGTDPNSPDTDEDGLTDYDEIYIYMTDPKNADTDNDKIKDGDEIALGLNPLVADTDGNGIIDGEEYIEQKVNTDRFDGDLYEDNVAVPIALTVSAQGNVNSNLRVSEYTGCDRGDSRSYVGKPIEISGAEMNAGSITFELDDSYQVKDYKFYGESTNGLLICYYNGEEFTQPLDTAYDETTRTLTADIVGQGMYFVLDVMDWIDSLGIEYSNFEPDDTDIAGKTFQNARSNRANAANIQIKGQADIVFIVDTTGSMDSYIANVKNNITEFVNEITEAGITPNFALVEYRDITIDGKNFTNAKKNTDNSNWFKNADEFKKEIASLSVSGGGDDPETVIDALEMARQLDLRKSSQKFFIVVTDAGYKINNNYGITSMDEMIHLLKEDGISVSVISNAENQSVYQPLYEETGGVFARVGSNFKKELLSVADMIHEETNAGYWIALFGPTPQIVKLGEKPMYGGTCDTDGDTIPDWIELNYLENGICIDTRPFLTGLHLKYSWMIGETLLMYMYTSNPVMEDTDNDGLLDGTAIYVEYTNSKGMVERLEAAPKDPAPKIYNGPKNVWKTHIASMQSGDKLATEDSDDYYGLSGLKWKKWHGIPYPDVDFEKFLTSLSSSFGSYGCDFRYDSRHIAVHSYGFQWQMLGGYNDLYDVVFDIVCSMNKKKVYIENFEGTDYVIWAWKGNYLNLGTGSEVGFYEKKNDLGIWYISDSLKMSCSLYKKLGEGDYTNLYNWYPQEYQWWTTGFVPDVSGIKEDKLIQVSSVKLLSDDMYLRFKKDYQNSKDASIIVFDDKERKVWLVW